MQLWESRPGGLESPQSFTTEKPRSDSRVTFVVDYCNAGQVVIIGFYVVRISVDRTEWLQYNTSEEEILWNTQLALLLGGCYGRLVM
jgi:hypothetical protein